MTMKTPRPSTLALVAVILCALGLLIWIDVVRVRHVEYVTQLGGSATPGQVVDNQLIVPEHNNISYHWISQTQQMLEKGDWRLRRIDYENAPVGRLTMSASPYRWWLGLVASLDHEISGRSLAASVEWAALWGDAILHWVYLVFLTVMVCWHFGLLPGALTALGVALLYPLGTDFLAGMPEDRGLTAMLCSMALLPLLAGLAGRRAPAKGCRRCFIVAGVMGGLGLWVNAIALGTVLLGVAIGGLVAAWVSRSAVQKDPVGVFDPGLWRFWAISGAVTSLVAYLIEFAPSYLGLWHMNAVHPAYGLAWIGLGELMVVAGRWIQGRTKSLGWKDIVALALSLAAISAVPLVLWKLEDRGFMTMNFANPRLARTTESTTVASFWAWMVREGITPQTWATFLPVCLVPFGLWLLLRRTTATALRSALAVVLGPVLGLACLSFAELGWWSRADALLLILLVAVTAGLDVAFTWKWVRWAWFSVAALVLLVGLPHVAPWIWDSDRSAVSEAELKALIERDFAHWIAKRTGDKPAMVLTTPDLSASLHYYGGVKGFGSLGWDNRDSLMVAVRILSATTLQESKELIDRRGVTHLVIPSWDTSLESYVMGGAGQMYETFMNSLKYWQLPPWLRPVPYQMPKVSGFESHTLTVFEVVEDQDPATALSVNAEFFVEMGLLDSATGMAKSLRRFPADLGAWIARARVELATKDEAGLASSFKVILPKLKNGSDKNLPWERRVSLAVVLALGKQPELAKEQVRRCIAEANEARLRTLSTTALYRLVALAKTEGIAFNDEKLHALALDLLPPESRERLSR